MELYLDIDNIRRMDAWDKSVQILKSSAIDIANKAEDFKMEAKIKTVFFFSKNIVTFLFF